MRSIMGHNQLVEKSHKNQLEYHFDNQAEKL